MFAEEHRQLEISSGQAILGIELGSTRIKTCLISQDLTPLAAGSHEWESTLDGGHWTYSLEAIREGLQSSYAALIRDVAQRYGVTPRRFAAIGVSAMMHGYLALDAEGALLVPFRTWRNTSTTEAASALSAALDFMVPLRWSIAHLYQAVLDEEPHVSRIASITTLAGWVHQQLTGRNVLGVGDASGMFPIDSSTGSYDGHRMATTQRLLEDQGSHLQLHRLLPEVLPAGALAGSLTPAGARFLDPGGTLESGIPLCPPEGDAGTGMVATGAVAPRTGNVSVGTSIFGMVVLERPLLSAHPEIDLVTTPAGDPVAMVHCNNGASEIATWARIFGRFSESSGYPLSPDEVYAVLLEEALRADPDAGGLLAYNFLAAEPIVGVETGTPLLVRGAATRFTLGNLMRAELFAAFAALGSGMNVLAQEGAGIDRMLAHGGLFRTSGPAQRLLAAALGVPVAVSATAAEGGAWGIAALAAFSASGARETLATFLTGATTGGGGLTTVEASADEIAGFQRFAARHRSGLNLQSVAATVPPIQQKKELRP
ncbi:FGGY-family carbohydrate kinase [Psychromicrobium xiongbiense]|uniref:FGGY-family carbohydrate kinase n=1 Tax=Psychromicrobium xiongbiense TaxID=3051184 RepID=UPI00255287D4|nr:FGGY-family carbohydrate kinase [Psychromicrobium sp. YIM S02556]